MQSQQRTPQIQNSSWTWIRLPFVQVIVKIIQKKTPSGMMETVRSRPGLRLQQQRSCFCDSTLIKNVRSHKGSLTIITGSTFVAKRLLVIVSLHHTYNRAVNQHSISDRPIDPCPIVSSGDFHPNWRMAVSLIKYLRGWSIKYFWYG